MAMVYGGFRCPKCGGSAFGRETMRGRTGDVEVLPMWTCHSDSMGRALTLPGAGRPCAWSGRWDELTPMVEGAK